MARGGASRTMKAGGLAPWQARLALHTLVRDLCAQLPVAELAARCGLSRSYFSKAFKATTGTSPHRWLLRQRVRRAAELLERTDDSVSRIAASCGFADQSHLTRTFHAIVGVSPAAWRRQRRAGVAPPIAMSLFRPTAGPAP